MPATVTVQPAWQVYSKQPAPLHNYDKVNIGDVGYIRQGRFHLLFSASLPLGDRQPGVDVPLNFVPIEPGPTVKDQPRLPGALHTQYIEQKGAGFSASSDIACIDVGTTFRFESSSKRGAILLTKYKTFCEDAERLGFFKDYLLRHNSSWVDFANQLGHMVNMEDILLVTGHDMTLDFAMLAFSSNSRQIGIEFEAGVPAVASMSASVWGSWRTTMSVHHNCGPQHREPPEPDSMPLPEDSTLSTDTGLRYNQCVFLRGFRFRRRAGVIPTVIKAAAGPHDLGSGHRFEDDGLPLCTEHIAEMNEEEFISDTPPFIDPLTPLFSYIFEHSTADAALLHDLDLAELLMFTGTSTAEDMKVLVSRLSPNMIELGMNGIACFKLPARCGLSKRSATGISQDSITIGQHGAQDVRGVVHTTQSIMSPELDRSSREQLEIQAGHAIHLFVEEPSTSDDPTFSLDGIVNPGSSAKPGTTSKLKPRPEGESPERSLPIHRQTIKNRNRRASEISPVSGRPTPAENVGRSPPSISPGERRPFSEWSLNQPLRKSSFSVPAAKAEAGTEAPGPTTRSNVSGLALERPLPTRPVLLRMLQAQSDHNKRPLPLPPVPLPMVQAQIDSHPSKRQLMKYIPSSFRVPQQSPVNPSALRRSRPPMPIGPRKPPRRDVRVQASSLNTNIRMPTHSSVVYSSDLSVNNLILPTFELHPGSGDVVMSQKMSRLTIRQSGADGAALTNLLPHDALDGELPTVISLLEKLLEEYKSKYHAIIRRRRVLARSISVYARGSDKHTRKKLLRELVDVSLACDHLSQDLIRVMDDLQQITNFGPSVSESTPAGQLTIPNSTLSKSSELLQLRLQMAQLEVERNEAWQIAERCKHDLLTPESPPFADSQKSEALDTPTSTI